MSKSARIFSVAALVGLAAIGTTPVLAQGEGEIESDAVWHNRYHALLALSLYGDPAETCPGTFTEATLRQNFPDTTLEPFQILQRFGPTEHGAEGVVFQIPEMDKVVIAFKGNYGLEVTIPHAVAPLDSALGLGGVCANCTANEFALQGYLEARRETDNWALAQQRVEETGLELSMAGHGLGGMHSIIASIDLGWAGVCRWSHNHGAPRTLNAAGAAMYTRLFAGESGERGVANNDGFVELIPAGPDYAFTGTPFYYSGYSNVTHMQMHVCRDAPEDPACAPRTPYNVNDHYFLFDHAGRCGAGRWIRNETYLDNFVASITSEFQATATVSSSMPNATAVATAVNSTTVAEPTTTAAPSSAVTSATAGIAGAAANAPTVVADSGASTLRTASALAVSVFAGLAYIFS